MAVTFESLTATTAQCQRMQDIQRWHLPSPSLRHDCMVWTFRGSHLALLKVCSPCTTNKHPPSHALGVEQAHPLHKVCERCDHREPLLDCNAQIRLNQYGYAGEHRIEYEAHVPCSEHNNQNQTQIMERSVTEPSNRLCQQHCAHTSRISSLFGTKNKKSLL